jgi:hypothetical protein
MADIKDVREIIDTTGDIEMLRAALVEVLEDIKYARGLLADQDEFDAGKAEGFDLVEESITIRVTSA